MRVRWLRAHAAEYHIDPARIGASGNSAGGHLALLLGLVEASSGLEERGGPFPGQPSRVQAAVSDSGPIDLLAQYQHGGIKTVVERFLGGPPDGPRLAEYRRASPVNHLAGPTPPLLLIYGEADEQVDVKTADQFVAQLSREDHTDITYIRLAKVGHCPHSLKRQSHSCARSERLLRPHAGQTVSPRVQGPENPRSKVADDRCRFRPWTLDLGLSRTVKTSPRSAISPAVKWLGCVCGGAASKSPVPA